MRINILPTLTRAILCVAFLLASTVTASAADITVSARTFPNWQSGGSVAYLRYLSTEVWYDSTGTPRGGAGFYQEITCTVTGTTVSCPSHVTQTTTDSIDRPNTRINVKLYDYRKIERLGVLLNAQIPTTLGTVTTFGDLVVYNRALPRPLGDQYLNRDQINARLASVNHPYASDVVRGTNTLSVAPEDSALPIAVGDNDERITAEKFLAKYASLQAAVTDAGSDAVTLVISKYTDVTLTTNYTIPSTMNLRFIGEGALNLVGAYTVSVDAPIIEAPTRRIFYGTANVRITKTPQLDARWFGATAAAADNGGAINRALYALGATAGTRGGVLLIAERYTYTTPINGDNLRNVTIKGVESNLGSGSITGTASRSALIFTGTGSGDAISLRSANATTLTGLHLQYTNSGFTGSLITYRDAPGGGDAMRNVIDSCVIEGDHNGGAGVSTAACLIDWDGSVVNTLKNSKLGLAQIGVWGQRAGGSGQSNAHTIDNNEFIELTTAAIADASENWRITNNTFEGLRNSGTVGMSRAYKDINTSKTPVGITFAGNWFGDGFGLISGVLSDTWLELKNHRGTEVTGNYFGQYAYGVRLASSWGVEVSGNKFDFNGVDLGSPVNLNRGIVVNGNATNELGGGVAVTGAASHENVVALGNFATENGFYGGILTGNARLKLLPEGELTTTDDAAIKGERANKSGVVGVTKNSGASVTNGVAGVTARAVLTGFSGSTVRGSSSSATADGNPTNSTVIGADATATVLSSATGMAAIGVRGTATGGNASGDSAIGIYGTATGASARAGVFDGTVEVNGTHRATRELNANVAVTFSATPTFDASLGNLFRLTLTSNVTSSSVTNPPASGFTQRLTLVFVQDATGGRTVAFPSNFRGAGVVSATANATSSQSFQWDGTNWIATGAMVSF